MPRPSLLALLLFSLTICAVEAASWEKDWQRIEVQAHLDNAGTVTVSERMTVRLTGDMETLERPLSVGPDQDIVRRRFVREDATGDVELKEGGLRETDCFYERDGVLTWNIKAPGTEWQGETLVFRLEYELRNALDPAWDIPIGPERFGEWSSFWSFPKRAVHAFSAWKDAGGAVMRRYRYEHEVHFPAFPATGPRETNYTLHFDDAWRMVHPESEFGRGAGECYRVSQLMEFSPPGRPSALALWKPAVRVGSLVAVIATAAIFSLLFILHEVRKLGLIGPRVDVAWFDETIAKQPPELLAWFAERGTPHGGLAHFLARMRQAGVLSIQTIPSEKERSLPKISMRLTGNTAGLRPYECAMLEALFPDGPESGTDVLAKVYAQSGFRPDQELAQAVAVQCAQDFPQKTAPGNALVWLHRLLGIVSVPLVLFAAFQGNRDWRLCMNALVAGLVLGVIPALIRRAVGQRGSHSAHVFIVAWAGLLVLVLIALHFGLNVPLSVFASAGLGLYWIWALTIHFSGTRTAVSTALARKQRDAALAANYARKQLQRPHPALRDAWLPHLRALGLDGALKTWRELPRHTFHAPAMQPDNLPPFTGILRENIDPDWIDALCVLTGDEAREAAEDEARAAKG